MADSDGSVPLPEGFTLAEPNASVSNPSGASVPIPPGFTTGSSWSGSFFPVSQDAKGNYSFDLSAGLPGAAIRAFTTPYDIVHGNLQTPYGTGATNLTGRPTDWFSSAPNADIQQRAADFTSFFGPMSAAARAGEIVPGTLTRRTVPSIGQLKSAADAGYAAARAADVQIPATEVQSAVQSLQQRLQDEHGLIPKNIPLTINVLDELGKPAPQGRYGPGYYTYIGLEAARRGLSDIAGGGGPESNAAMQARNMLDEFIDQTSPDARDARANYAAAMRSNAITGELDKGNTGFLERAEASAAASHSGLNLDNTIRQRVRTFLQNPDNLKGFSADEIAALNDVVRGSGTQNFLRYAGNLLGKGGGLGAGAVGYGLGHYFAGEPELGMALGVGSGRAIAGMENALARRSLNPVDEMIRMRSPLGQAYDAAGIRTPAMDRNSAVLRALLPGLLQPAPSPQQQPIPIGLLGGWA